MPSAPPTPTDGDRHQPRHRGLHLHAGPEYNGSASFTFKANDGQADSNVATVSITVNPVNDPPTADGRDRLDDRGHAPVGQPDRDRPRRGRPVLRRGRRPGPRDPDEFEPATGAFTYTPAADYNGADSFSVSGDRRVGEFGIRPVWRSP